MDVLNNLKTIAAEKHRECMIQSYAFSNTLWPLGLANLVFVVGAALLSLVAGATILIKTQMLTETHAAIMALVSGGLTIVHSKLQCDQYQSECKKLVSFYRGCAVDYSNLVTETDPEVFKKKLDALNNELSTVVKNSNSTPFDWALKRASRRLD